MEDFEKSREDLLSEIAALRHELDDMRARQSMGMSHTLNDNAFCTTLLREVPEYLYSVEYTNGNLTSVFHSPQCQDITGYGPEEYITNPNLWIDMIHPDDREMVRVFLQGLREPLSCKLIEHRILHKSGAVRWVLNMSTMHQENNGGTQRQSGFLIDVTERREADERTRELLDETRRSSFTDDLTQLFNRRAFRVLAEQQVRIAGRMKHQVLVFFLDVDGLKVVNDTLGHAAGDRLLINTAEILRETFRESDIIARMGGDEFAVLSMDTGPDSRDLLLARLQENIDRKNRETPGGAELSVSAGVAQDFLGESDPITGLLDRADRDMYERKLKKPDCRKNLSDTNCLKGIADAAPSVG